LLVGVVVVQRLIQLIHQAVVVVVLVDLELQADLVLRRARHTP
jgi:hypothetical protein